jgi:hypothetical protein
MLTIILLGVIILVLLHTASLAVLRIVHRETNSTLAKTQQKLDVAIEEIRRLKE